MNIQDALKETGKALLVLSDDEEIGVAQWRNESIWWCDAITGKWRKEVGHVDLLEGDWQPYYEEKEIRPESPGELWKKRYSVDFTSYFHTEYDSSLLLTGSRPPLLLVSGTNAAVTEEAVHGKNGWTRLYPPVQDEE